MAGQGPSRRELLHALTLGSAAYGFSGFWRWRYALAEPKSSQATLLSYQPRFFSPAQYRTVEQLADCILPAGEEVKNGRTVYYPSASDAGVAEFIDFSAASDPSLHTPFREGLAWMDRASAPSASFVSSSAAAQTGLLTRLAYKRSFRAGEETGQQFFRLFRKYAVTGYYTTEMGLRTLDAPNMVFYGTSPGCSHEGNPEHVGL